MFEQLSATVSALLGKPKTWKQQAWESFINASQKLAITIMLMIALIMVVQNSAMSALWLFTELNKPAILVIRWLGVATTDSISTFYEPFIAGGVLGGVILLTQIILSLSYTWIVRPWVTPHGKPLWRTGAILKKALVELATYWIPVISIMAIAYYGGLPWAQGILDTIKRPALYIIHHMMMLPPDKVKITVAQAVLVGTTMNIVSMFLLFLLRLPLYLLDSGTAKAFRAFRPRG